MGQSLHAKVPALLVMSGEISGYSDGLKVQSSIPGGGKNFSLRHSLYTGSGTHPAVFKGYLGLFPRE
jgi:hypothetical protein